jgi:4-hydroxybenzoate adenylyltransferase
MTAPALPRRPRPRPFRGADPFPVSGNLAANLEALAEVRGWAGRPAFHTPDRTWTHGEVHRGAQSVAHLMDGAGIGAGDTVLLASSDRAELVLALLGAARLGAVTVLVNPLLTPADHEFMVADTAPSLVVCEAALAGRFEPMAVTWSADRLSDLDPRTFPAAVVAPDAPLYAQYTSGTTGAPKAAVHRHSDPAGYFAAMGEGALGLGADDVVYSISKAYFAYGLGNTVFFPLLSGCSSVLDPAKPTVERAATNTAQYGATVLFAVPSFYARLAAAGDPAAFGSIRAAVTAGETLQPVLHERVRAWLGRALLDGLGSTEVGQTFISNTVVMFRAGSIGIVLPGYEAEIRSDTGAPMPPGGVGSLWVRGDTVMLGYRNRPEQTASVLVDGWCRTGDRASVDGDGFYFHHGRLDDLEIVGGINVSPLEIESVLLEHPSVVEIAVAVVPDGNGVSCLRAFAVVATPAARSAALEDEILAPARQRLARFKVPRSVTFVDSLPRTASGKLRRYVLRAGWPPPA